MLIKCLCLLTLLATVVMTVPVSGKDIQQMLATSGDIELRVSVPSGWHKVDQRIQEAKDATFTVVNAQNSAWVAFCISRPPKPEYAKLSLWSVFHHERIDPFFRDFIGPPGSWDDGRRTYYQIPWYPKRKQNNKPLIAQTSVIWDLERGVRFEILQLLIDNSTPFAFSSAAFAFEAQIFRNGKQLFPR